MTKFTVDYFIKKFEAIPEDEWLDDGDYSNAYGTKFCAFGHCGRLTDQWNDEATALQKIIKSAGLHVISLNDKGDGKYYQPTPKQRILAALYDIKKLSSEQEVQVSDTTKLLKEPEAGTKIIHVYHSVSVPESITKQSKDLILQ